MVTVVLAGVLEVRDGTRQQALEVLAVRFLHSEVAGLEDPGWVITTSKAAMVPDGVKVVVRLVVVVSQVSLGRMTAPLERRLRPPPTTRWQGLVPRATARTILR